MLISNALLPVLFLLVLGVLLRRLRVLDVSFTLVADRLIYFIFFPVTLFAKIGGSPLQMDGDGRYLVAALLAVLAAGLLSLLLIRRWPVAARQAGSFSQGCYRFNTYVGMAVIVNALGATGAQLYGILVGLLIPCINGLAVGVLIWYGGMATGWRQRLSITVRQLLINPLILACLAGMFYAWQIGTFPVFIGNTLQMLSQLSLPLALLSIGAGLHWGSLRHHLPLALLATVVKLVLLPGFGWLFLTLLEVQGTPWQVVMLFLTLPTSTAIYILSGQLGSDTDLAAAIIVLSTLLSFLPMAAVLVFIQ